MQEPINSETPPKEDNMQGHDSTGNVVRIEQVISVGLVGNKNWMQERVIKEGPADILKITGYANEHNTVKKKDTDDTRSTTYIKGAFKAVNLMTGENYLSGQLILPDSASGYVCANIDLLGPLNIDLTLRVERAEKSIVGYKFAALMAKLEPKNPPKTE